MKRFKTWYFTVLLLSVLSICLIIFVNCTVDAYGILRSDFSRQFQEPSWNVVKAKFILNHKQKYDSFIFGSSRLNFIDNAKIPKGTYYNFWYSEGLPKEHLDNIKLLLKYDIRIKNILIGLDDFSYMVDPETHRSNLLRQPHPLVSGKTFPVFYAEYFVKTTNFLSSVRSYILHNYLHRGTARQSGLVFDIQNTGRMISQAWDAQIENDPATHLRDPKFQTPMHYVGDSMTQTLESIREIVALAMKNNSKLTVFINPIHNTTYLAADREQFLTFKKKLAAITPYYDFSGLNSITMNNYYYYETSHYREMVGDMMLKSMYGAPSVSVPADFGVLVTARNVEAHLAALRSQFKKRNPVAHAGSPVRTVLRQDSPGKEVVLENK